MNLFLHGIEDFQVVRGDTLRNPAFFEGDRLATFDCVIANPPFSLEKWGEDVWLSDPFGRNFAGLPPSSSGDFAWVQHMVKSMADVSGRMAVVLPQGALFRKGAEGEIRRKLLEMDLLEAVIGLAPNLFYGTGLAACILVLRKRKAAAHKKKVLIADGLRLTAEVTPRTIWSPRTPPTSSPGIAALPTCRTRPAWSASTRSRPRTGH